MSLSRRLQAAGVPHLLPLARHDRVEQRSGQRRITDKALFPGYLFITGERGLADAKPSALKGLVSACPVPDVVTLVADLSRLCDVLDSGVTLSGTAPLQSGDPVRVVSGPLQGKEGKFVRGAGRDWLLIEVHMIGRAAAVEVESWRVERIDPR